MAENKNPMSVTNLSCCGVKEFGGLAGASWIEYRMDRDTGVETRIAHSADYGERLFKALKIHYQREGNRWPGIRCGVVLFSQAYSTSKTDGYGNKFAEYLIGQNLGDVHLLPEFINPNTNNRVQVFAWYVDQTQLNKWWEERFEEENHKSNPTVQPASPAFGIRLEEGPLRVMVSEDVIIPFDLFDR